MSDAAVRVLLLLLATTIAVIVGLLSGILSRAGGSPLPTAVRHGGVAFGGTVPLVIVVMTALHLL
jgi:hypothetical protein